MAASATAAAAAAAATAAANACKAGTAEAARIAVGSLEQSSPGAPPVYHRSCRRWRVCRQVGGYVQTCNWGEQSVRVQLQSPLPLCFNHRLQTLHTRAAAATCVQAIVLQCRPLDQTVPQSPCLFKLQHSTSIQPGRNRTVGVIQRRDSCFKCFSEAQGRRAADNILAS